MATTLIGVPASFLNAKGPQIRHPAQRVCERSRALYPGARSSNERSFKCGPRLLWAGARGAGGVHRGSLALHCMKHY